MILIESLCQIMCHTITLFLNIDRKTTFHTKVCRLLDDIHPFQIYLAQLLWFISHSEANKCFMQTKYCCFPYCRIYLHKFAYFKINVTIYGFKNIIRITIGGANDGRVAMLLQVRAFTMSILITVGNHEIRIWVCFRIAHFPYQDW